MESIPCKPLRAAYHCSLALLGLTCLLGTVNFPVPGWRLRKRSGTSSI